MPGYIPDPFYHVPKTSCGFSSFLNIPFIDNILLYWLFLLLFWLLQWAAIAHAYAFYVTLVWMILRLIKGILEGKRSVDELYKIISPDLAILKMLVQRFLFIVFLYIILLLIAHLLSFVTASQFSQFVKMMLSKKFLEIPAPPDPEPEPEPEPDPAPAPDQDPDAYPYPYPYPYPFPAPPDPEPDPDLSAIVDWIKSFFGYSE